MKNGYFSFISLRLDLKKSSPVNSLLAYIGISITSFNKLISNPLFFKVSSIVILESSLCSSVVVTSFPYFIYFSGRFAVLYKFISTGVISFKSLCIVFLSDKLEDSIVIVINNIKQITLMLATVVLILLLICLNTNIFVPFKYVLFLN